jgi:23S rRNA (cytosine1962-C5)-methyltransferase
VTASITLKKHEDKRILAGHLWVFSNEIATIDGEPKSGDIVTVRAHGGKPIGKGFYHPNSLIAFRLLTRGDAEIDFHFFQARIERALALRTILYPGSKTFRLVYGESDLLPGLIIDKYHHHLSIQAFSAGMDRRMTLICDVLESLLKPKGIVERNESQTRTLEGLELRKGLLRGEISPVTIEEHGLKYEVDLLEGQKTGFFLDQRENRFALRRYAKGARVLDCFSNDGGFALNAAAGGAKKVTAVDSSGVAMKHTAANAALNDLASRVTCETADAFEWLGAAVVAQKEFDLINLDPPSFAKNRKSVPVAKKGYRELHSQAMKLLVPGGILATSSCSYHIEEPVFAEIVQHAAQAAGRTAQLLEWRGASPDHPVLPAMPETRYLKFGIFRVE